MEHKHLVHFTSGAIALSVPFAFMHPLDTLKTQIQASRRISNRVLSTQLQALMRGFFSSVCGAAPQGGLRLMTYEASKEWLDERRVSFSSALAAIAGDFVSSIVKVPREVITSRLQTSTDSSFSSVITEIIYKDGIKGLFKGFWITSARDWPFMVILFTTYERLHHFHLESDSVHPLVSTFYGGTSGALAGFITTPLDVIRTRIMTLPRQSLSHILKDLNSSNGFFKGAVARSSWWFVVCSCFFPIYENMNDLLNKF